jgi:Domain of unknown function (DUF5063)
MNIDRQEIFSSALHFLELIESNQSENPIKSLELALDEIALLAHFIGDVSSDEKEYLGAASTRDYPQWREIITKRFPSFGFYNVPSVISHNIGGAKLLTGDAIDDLVDIAKELSEFVWLWQYTSENNALWHLQFSYESHLGSHLRSLQMYLHALKTMS